MTDKEVSETAVAPEEPLLDESLASGDSVEAEAASAVQEQASVEEAPAVAPEIAVTATEDVVDDNAAPTEVPERPWTPSYSVTTQGPGTTEETTEVEVEEAAVTVEQPTESTIPEVSNICRCLLHALRANFQVTVEAATVALADETTSTSQSWPVSYSVSSQGNSPMHKPQELAEPVEPIEPLDTVEVVAEDVVIPPAKEVVLEQDVQTPEVVIEAEPEVSLEEISETAVEVIDTPKIITPDEEPSTETQELAEVRVLSKLSEVICLYNLEFRRARGAARSLSPLDPLLLCFSTRFKSRPVPQGAGSHCDRGTR